MTFQWPWLLWGLLTVPIVIVVYLAWQRRRAISARAFARAEMMPNVVVSSPRWRRHVPAVFYVLALVTLILAAARPERAMSVPRERATVILAMDSSHSMLATDVEPDRLGAAKNAAYALLDRLPHRFQVGVVGFSRRAKVLSRPTTDRVAVRSALESLQPKVGTAIGDGLVAALESRPQPEEGEGRVPMVVVLLSDGNATTGVDPVVAAERARRQEVRVFTVAFGGRGGTRPGGKTVRAPDGDTLAEMAEVARGLFFEAPTAADLEAVYERLGSDVARVRQRREITTAFMGAGLVLLLLGGGAAVAWFNRFP